MRSDDVIFYRIIYRNENGEVHFKDYKTKEDFLIHPLYDCILISARKFKGETSRDVTYLFRKFFEKTENMKEILRP